MRGFVIGCFLGGLYQGSSTAVAVSLCVMAINRAWRAHLAEDVLR